MTVTRTHTWTQNWSQVLSSTTHYVFKMMGQNNLLQSVSSLSSTQSSLLLQRCDLGIHPPLVHWNSDALHSVWKRTDNNINLSLATWQYLSKKAYMITPLFMTSKKCWNMGVTRKLAPVFIRQFLHSYWSRATAETVVPHHAIRFESGALIHSATTHQA